MQLIYYWEGCSTWMDRWAGFLQMQAEARKAGSATCLTACDCRIQVIIRTPTQHALIMQITRRLEFDAGHRIPSHTSQCRHLHGHRYAIEITLSGEIITTDGISEQGMIMDYSEVKRIAKEQLVDAWDHAFLVYRNDQAVLDFLNSLPNHKTVVLEVPPTAENLAMLAFKLLDSAYRHSYGNNLQLERVRIYETPNNWADCLRNSS
ncbi:MAG: 6-pyruvoyltetrahydropterin/6-carboxytetrahydropterin synthase [Candidatus Nitrotoga sp. MKT]|nr:MAG: 6-pyruvoyltetrahydropterin/6-carboxytetrahydropterin synthase [Candidatus Nitrotoga sp. MKT]